jgi:hypothetical protein
MISPLKRDASSHNMARDFEINFYHLCEKWAKTNEIEMGNGV